MQVIDGTIQWTVPEDHMIAMLWQVLTDEQRDKMRQMLRETRGKLPMAAVKLDGNIILPNSRDGFRPPPLQ